MLRDSPVHFFGLSHFSCDFRFLGQPAKTLWSPVPRRTHRLRRLSTMALADFTHPQPQPTHTRDTSQRPPPPNQYSTRVATHSIPPLSNVSGGERVPTPLVKKNRAHLPGSRGSNNQWSAGARRQRLNMTVHRFVNVSFWFVEVRWALRVKNTSVVWGFDLKKRHTAAGSQLWVGPTLCFYSELIDVLKMNWVEVG